MLGALAPPVAVGKTVEAHLSRAYSKLGIRSRARLAKALPVGMGVAPVASAAPEAG